MESQHPVGGDREGVDPQERAARAAKEESRFDIASAELFGRYSESFSRRGLIAKAGKGLFGALGLSIAAALPINRAIEPTLGAVTCSTYSLCGLSGRICTCCNGGCGTNCCPYGTSWYSYWSRCCRAPDNYWDKFLYWDCCGGSVNCGSCLWCTNYGSQPAWCNGTTYRCTAVVYGGNC